MKGEEDRVPRRKGDPIPVRRVWRDGPAPDASGAGMGEWTVFDFAATYPVGEIRLAPEWFAAGKDRIAIECSLNGKQWHPACEASRPANGESAAQAGDVHARYVRIAATSDASAPPAAHFAAGTGLAAEPAEDWTRLFHRKKGWTGGDGIYSIALNGADTHGRAAETKTLFVFGDTFIGDVDEATDARLEPVVMINNSLAILEGDRPDPAAITFRWNREGDTPASAIVPTTPNALKEKGAYYWLQDAASVGGWFHCFPLIIGPNPDGPEGFQFTVHGVAHVAAPMGPDGPELERQVQQDTPLYFRSAGGHTTYFGAAIMPNTEEAGVPDPDGYVYIYGLQQDGGTKLVAARVPAGDLGRIECWRYWNGREWTERKEDCAPIVPDVSCELSVSPMVGGFLHGKYVIVCQLGGITGNCVAVYWGDSPVGPFGPCVPLHYCSEPEEGKGIYAYNAKGHPHLSPAGELLVSYNVNTTSMDAHMAHAGIYRPRFVRIRQIS